MTKTPRAFDVRPVTYSEAKPWVLKKHYAQRLPSISYAFGLFDKDSLIGVCTIGKSSNRNLSIGICGAEYRRKVFELNRFIIAEGLPKNTSSYFISSVLKLLKNDDLILVAYSDEAMGHYGYIYQATNWLYMGKTRKRTNFYTPNKHSRHSNDETPHLRRIISSKHRYVYFTGKSRSLFLSKMKYEILDYPKGDPSRYILGEKKKEGIVDVRTGEVFYE